MLRSAKLLTVISMILAIIIFVEIPVGAVVPVLENDIVSDDIIVNHDIEQHAEENKAGVIISELEEERTEYSKTFRLDNGTNMVAQYAMPIHYKDDKGKWTDYDNSLLSTEEEFNVAETQSLSTSEATADSVATFASNTKTEKKQVLKNKKSNADISFAQQSSDENMVFVKNKKHTVSWGYKNINSKDAKPKTAKKIRTGNDKFTVLDNLTSTVVYESAYKDVDIECITTPVGVKENIILNKKSATNVFVTTYNIGELRAEKLNDRVIALYNAEDEIEYYINALYMFDANNETSEDIVLNILENSNGKLTVELVASKEWLNSSDRAYPVTIDPSFNYGQEWGDVQCTYIDSANPNTAYGYGSSTGYTGTVYTGTYGYGNYRSLMKINKLPKLNKGDMIIGAIVWLPLYSYDLYDDAYVGVYEAEENWSQSAVTWNNQPNCSSLLVDYCNAYDSLNNGCCYWDITKLVKQWYNGNTNNGIYFKMVSESTNQQCVGFYSSNYPLTEDYRPVFQLTYLNNKGVEDRWSYTSFSVGNVGTAHINDYSGALTFELPIASTADPYMSAGVSYIYNSYMANTKYNKNAPYFGDGWRMNMQQTVLPSSDFGLKGDDAKNYPYVYTDADGTDHYFQKVTEDGKTKYVDEGGLDLELTIDSESNGSRYTITDKDKNKWYFHKTGLLNRFQDTYGNKQQVSYDGTKITTISDKTNNQITFNINSSNYVTSIKDPDDKLTTFEYDSGNRVTKVTRHDDTYAQFTYYSNGLIKTITDCDGYAITFTYDSTGTKSVASVQEYGTKGIAGTKMTFDRTNYNETVIRSPGANGEDCITTCQFDNYGRMTAAYSKTAGGSDMGAESFSYTSGKANSSGTNIDTLNKVSKHHNLGANTVNYARNTSLESTTNWNEPEKFSGSSHSSSSVSAEKLYGKKSLLLDTASSIGTESYIRYQDITNIPTDNYYTLSGYIKVTELSNPTQEVFGAALGAQVYNSDGSKTMHLSEYITEVTDESINNGWRRVNVTFELPAGATKVRISTRLSSVEGTAYFDAIQVEYGKNVGSYNMIQNASFESNSNHVPSYWSNYRNLNFGDSKDGIAQRAHDGSESFSIKGNVTQSKALYQEIPVSGVEADTYILSGWAKTTTAIPVDDRNNRFRLSVHVIFAEKDSNGDNYVEIKDPPNFNTSITDWQFSSYAFTLSDGTKTDRTPIAIRVFLTYALQGNRAYFDDIQLVKEPAQSYTYDDEGNLISVVATAQQNTSYEYNANKKVKSYTDPEGNKYKYTYNDQGSLATYTNASGTKYTYKYNDNGFLTESAAISSAGNKIITTNALSTDSNAGTYTVTSTDSLGYQTSATYDAKDGTLKSAQDARNNSITYTYNDKNDVLQSVTQGSSTISYIRDSSFKNLLGITTPTSEYSFTYDEFGNRTATKVGNRTLATYSYGTNTGMLQSMKYGPENGDGDEITYTYDKYGNVRTENLNGTTVYEGLADKTGAVTKAIDRANNLQYNYVYDSTDRLISSTRTDTITNSRVAMFEYDFDLNNNMTKLAVLTPHGSNVTQYTYGADNLPATSTFSNGKVLTQHFDSVCLQDWKKIDTANEIRTDYTYYREKGSDFDKLTGVVKTEISGAFKYRYNYNENYNITEIYEGAIDPEDDTTGTLAETYTYNSLDQLTQVDYLKQNKRVVYTYDRLGNIQKEKIYNLDDNGTATLVETNSYVYEDPSWGDLLTKYDGQTITYDAIGNPLKYRDDIDFTWSNGRQLSSYTKGDTTVEYTYDTDGMRLTKTVDGVEYTYLYENGLLVQETKDNRILDYSYDANGKLTMVKYSIPYQNYVSYFYYALNSRGDVIGLYNSNGDLIAKYNYDVWGNILSVKDATDTAITSATHIANFQSFRYRSYYYDTDSGFYYLQSRYYDPVTHRFINADSCYYTGTGLLGYNMYAYCDNNPVNCSDPSGMSSHYCGNPACFKCRPERRDFINNVEENRVEWYNNVTGSNILGVDYKGEFIYSTPIVIDTNSLEFKVLRTVWAALKSFELSFDVGCGVGADMTLYSVLNLGVQSTATIHIDVFSHEGFDVGWKSTPVKASISVWDFGVDGELSYFESYITKKSKPIVGSDKTIDVSAGAYVLLGASVEFGFNYGYFSDEVRKVW